MKKMFTILFFVSVVGNFLFAEEVLGPDSVKISKKIITINQEAIREPASEKNSQNLADTETLSDAMEKLEEPKLWFNP